MLCTECQVICTEDIEHYPDDPLRDGKSLPDFEPIKPFKPSFSALKQSASDGCRVCRHVVQLFKNDQRFIEYGDLGELDDLPVRVQWWATDDYREGRIFVQVHRPEASEESGEIDFMRQTGLFVFLEISTDRGMQAPVVKPR